MTTRAWRALVVMLVVMLVALLVPGGADARISESALARAIVDSDVDVVRRAVAEGPVDWQATVTAADQSLPLLRLAIEVAAGHLPGVNVKGDNPRAVEVARVVFGAGADPNYSWNEFPSEGSPVPHFLVERAIRETPDLVDVLIGAGLDMKSAGVGESLILASERGWVDTVRRFVEKGADVNYTQRRSSRTALSEAVHQRQLAVIDVLERAGAREW